jgi:DNA-binding response OmpR family regulator
MAYRTLGHHEGWIMRIKKWRPRVLIADGDRNLRSVTRSILEPTGYKVATVDSAAKALKEIQNSQYDLLVLYIALPGNMVVKLFHTLKKNKKCRDIPILFILGSRGLESLPQEKREIVERADGTLQKPLRAKILLDTVRTILEGENGGMTSRRSEKNESSWWMFWMPWRRPPATMESLVDSERRISK